MEAGMKKLLPRPTAVNRLITGSTPTLSKGVFDNEETGSLKGSDSEEEEKEEKPKTPPPVEKPKKKVIKKVKKV